MANLMNKKVLIAIVAVILIIWFFSSRSDNAGITGTTATTTQAVATTSAAKTTTVVKKTVPLANQPVSLSYQQALETYKGSYRIQLSGTSFCQANPTTVMYKNGTSIMIDNRSPDTRTIRIGTTSYTLTGYGFKIVKLTSSILPTTLVMDCGAQQNIAKITLQK